MKLKKKILGLGLVLAVSLGCAIPASAVTVWYDWIFVSTNVTLPAAVGKKNDMEQNYYFTVVSGNVSSSNILGTRVRRAEDDASVSGYELHKYKEQSVPYSYTTYVDQNHSYYMNGKKDSESTSSATLSATGKITY